MNTDPGDAEYLATAPAGELEDVLDTVIWNTSGKKYPEEWLAILKARPDADTPEVQAAVAVVVDYMTPDTYTYRAEWSEADGEYVGLCCESFASLSWLAPTPEEAIEGIRKLVTEALRDIDEGEEYPAPQI